MVVRDVVITTLTEPVEELVHQFEKPVPIEELPLLLWFFVLSEDLARTEIRLLGEAAVVVYIRDDEMTHFHGRNHKAFYTFHRYTVAQMTLEQFEASRKAGGHKPLSGG